MEEEVTKINKKGKHSENLKEKKVKSKKKNFKNPEETKKRKKGKVIKIVLIVVLVIIIALGIVIGTFVNGKLSKINFQKLDENNLEINDNMYEETEGLSQKEYDQVINIMLLGSDSKDMNDTYGGNSDAMIIV